MEHLENNLPDSSTIKCETLNDLNDYLSTISGLKIMHINIRSLNKNIDNLKLCINSMLQKPDIIICTETFEINCVNLFDIEGYDLFCVNSNLSRNDGSCIYIKNTIKHANYSINIGQIKAIYTEIESNSGKIYITSFYKSHSVTINDFMTELHIYLQNVSHLNDHLIMGDMNLDILRENDVINDYLNNYLEHGYRSMINIPTRITSNSATCIDHIFAKTSVNCMTTSIVCDLDLTDHLATMIILDTMAVTDSVSDKQFKSKIKYDKLLKLIADINWNNVYNEIDLNLALNQFIKIIEQTIESSQTKIRIHSKNKPRKEWITESLIISCKNKNLLYKKLKQNPNNIDLKNKYVKYKNMLYILIKKSQRIIL